MISIFHLQRLNCTVSSNFLLDKGRVAENLQKECFCYVIISSTSLWRNHFNHKIVLYCKFTFSVNIFNAFGLTVHSSCLVDEISLQILSDIRFEMYKSTRTLVPRGTNRSAGAAVAFKLASYM